MLLAVLQDTAVLFKTAQDESSRIAYLCTCCVLLLGKVIKKVRLLIILDCASGRHVWEFTRKPVRFSMRPTWVG
jgi:hypothetical protein